MPDKGEVNRRRFFENAGAAAACAVCAGAASGCKMITGVGDTPEISPSSFALEDGKLKIFLERVPELASVGGAVKLTREVAEPLIVARTADRDYVALSIKCTHGGREVEYQPEEKGFQCVSFGHSCFKTDGSVTKGPAESPLKTFPVSLEKGNLIVRL